MALNEIGIVAAGLLEHERVVDRHLKTCRDDPDLVQRHGETLRRLLGTAFLDAADALSDRQPSAALRMLLRASAHGALNLRTLKVLAKSFIPFALLSSLRGQR